MKNTLSIKSGLLMKKSIGALLCLLQVLPFQGLAGRPDVDQLLTQEDRLTSPIRSYGVRALDNRYHLSFQLTDQDKGEPVFFHDEETGVRLGQTAYLGETLSLIWNQGALSLDGSNIPSFLKQITVHSRGIVECGDATLPDTHFSFVTPSFVGRGNFLAQSIFVDSPSSTNFGIMDALALTIRGGAFHGHPGSTTLGRNRFDVEISGDYLMEGEARSLYQTIHAHNASFEGASHFTGIYLDLNTTSATFAPSSQFTLLAGAHLRTQRPLTLKGHFDIQNSPNALGRFFEGLLGHTLDDDQHTALVPVVDMARQKVRAPLSAASDARLIQLADVALHEGNVELTGKRVDVEGTMFSHSPDSKLRVGATTLIRVASPHLLPHMSLKAPKKLIVRASHLKSLTSKAGDNAPSTLTIGPGVTTTIGTWESSQEKIISSGDVDIRALTLRSPQEAAFTQLTTNQFKVRDAKGDVYIGKLALTGKGSIEAKKGEVLVSELIAPDAVFQAVGNRIMLLSAPQAGTIDVKALTRDVTITKAVAKVLKACALEGHLDAQDITSDATALQGTTVSLRGRMGGDDLNIAATQGDVVSTATLDPDASLNLTTDTMDQFQSTGSLKHLGLTTTRLSGTRAWLEGRQSLRPESLSLTQTSDSLINLEDRSFTIASPRVHLETPGPLEMRNTRLKAPGSLSLSAGSADLDFAHITAEEFHLKVKEDLSTQGVYIRGVRVVDVFAKKIKGGALKERRGNWDYEYDVLTARPEFICENGPLVVLAEEGLWLEVPILKGQSVMFGSLTNDATVIPVTLESAQRWVEEHRKKGGFCRRSKTSHSEHQVRTQTVIQPEIVSQTDLLTQAPQGTLNLHAAKVLVAGNWTVVAQTFGMEAAKALQERYSRVSRSSRSGFGVKTSNSTTSLESHEETVPPIMQIGGNLYLYCDDAHFEAIHGFVGGDVLSTAQKVTVGAHVVRHHRETHMTSKGPFMEAKSGRVDDSTRSTLSQLDIQGRFQGPEGSTLEITGPIPGIDIQGSEVVPLKPEHSDTSSSYSESKSKHGALLPTITTVAAVTATVYGGPVIGAAVGSLTSTTLQDSRFDGGKLALDMGKSAVIALAVPMVSDAVGLSAPATTFGEHARQAIVEQAVHTAVDVATGEDVQATLRRGALGIVTQSVGATAANGIAKSYYAGDIGYFTHKGAHALAAAGLGFATGGKEGAISGGIGAAVAEITVGALPNAKNPSQSSLLVPKLAGILAGGLIGKDPGAASAAASNALNNNWIFTMMMEAKREAEAWEYQKRLADEAKEDSPDAADHTQDSSEMRSLFSFIDEMRTKFGLPVNRPFLPTLKSEGKMFLPSPRNAGWAWGSTTKGADHRYESQHSESSPPIGLNIGFSHPMSGFPWTEEVLPSVTKATKERVRALRRWAQDTFTSNEPPASIESFFEGRETRIVTVRDLEDLPKYLTRIIPRKELASIKTQATDSYNRDASGLTFEDHEKLWALAWFADKRTEILKERRDRCEKIGSRGFALASERKKCASFLSFEEIKKLPPETKETTQKSGDALTSLVETLGVPQWFQESAPSSVDYEFIKYFPVGGHVPEPTEYFGKGSQVELPQGVSLFLKSFGQELSKETRRLITGIGFERKPREQAQREFFETSQAFYSGRYEMVTNTDLFGPTEGESPQPKAKGLYQTDPKDSQRRQRLLAIKSVDDVPEHWKGFVKPEHHEGIELICTSAISSSRLSESEQASLRAAENRCFRDEAYGFIRKEQEEMKAIGEFPKSTHEKSAVASFLRGALKGVKSLGEILPFSSKPAYAESVMPVDEQFRREDLPRPSAADGVNTIGSDVKQTSEGGSNFSDLNPTATSFLAATLRGAQCARKASLLKTDNLAAGINAIGSGVEQVSEWWGDFAYQNPTTASFLVETLRGAQYAGETVLVTTCCAASPVVTPGPCAASLAFVASNHSGFTEYAAHLATKGFFTPLLNFVPGVDPVYGANTATALTTGLSFLAAGKLISVVTKMGAPIGYGLPAINRDIVRVFDVNRGRALPLLAAEEVPVSMTNGRPLTVSDQFVLGEYCTSLSEAFGSIEKLKLPGRYNTGTEYATAVEEAFGSIFQKASERYDAAIEGIHNPSVPKGTIIKVHNEALKKIGIITDGDTAALPLEFGKGRSPLQPLREIKGFGPKKEQDLLNYFGSVEAISKASFSELKTVIPPRSASTVYEHFHGKAMMYSSSPDSAFIFEPIIDNFLYGTRNPLKPFNDTPSFSRTTSQRLIAHFGTPEAIAKASEVELQKIFLPRKARAIYLYFQEHITKWVVDYTIHRIPEKIPSVSLECEGNLLHHFGSVKNISKASEIELQAMPGITPEVARDVYQYFHKE